MRFRDRRDAGQRLAALVAELDLPAPIVLALPRGGVPVAAEVAERLGAQLDVLVARKLGAPQQPELGLGALAEGGVRVLDDDLVRRLGLTERDLEAVTAREQLELDRRVQAYRGGRPLPAVAGRAVVVVDDGVATGGTAEAALRSVRAGGPARLVLAVPTAAPDAVRRLAQVADDVVCVIAPESLTAVGQWYEDFTQTTDREVADLLAAARSAS
jgi:putative phosphoribosyl transferase